jgi:hypothetical protein
VKAETREEFIAQMKRLAEQAQNCVTFLEAGGVCVTMKPTDPFYTGTPNTFRVGDFVVEDKLWGNTTNT